MLVQLVVGIVVVAIIWVVYYFFGPGYEKHLCKDEPPINPQHSEETKLALQLVRSYAKANGHISDYEKIITTPEGGFSAWIGELQSFTYTPAKGLAVRTIADAQLQSDVTPELAQFAGNAVLQGGSVEFAKKDAAEVLVLVNEWSDLAGKKAAFVKKVAGYVPAAAAFDALLLETLQKSTGQSA